ncbi:MAG: WGR domain-containing protein [Deltaproteobacteria bacterium]|nr:MAG: WGR domain-containing protein [Deltaproteobacteria bacterium]
MSDWTVQLEFEEGTSSKFWRARVEGKTLYVNYGKIGSNGQTQVKDLADPAAARAEYEKLIREKRKKGYVDAGAHSASDGDDSAAAEQPEERDDDDGDEDDEDEAPPARKPSKPAAAAPASKPATAPASKPAATASSAPGHRLVLDAGGRKAETVLHLDGSTVRMDARESYASPDAAKKAFERLEKLLAGEGYKDA